MTETFRAALSKAKTEAIPVMALRPYSDGPEDRMDDIVVKDVETFRAEQMDADHWWMCCYFRNGERVTFNVTREKKPAGVSVWVAEYPAEWIDFDGRS